MIKQDAIAGIDAIGFAIINGDPISIQFSHGIRAAWIKGRGFFLRDFLYKAVQLAGGGLVKARGFL